VQMGGFVAHGVDEGTLLSPFGPRKGSAYSKGQVVDSGLAND